MLSEDMAEAANQECPILDKVYEDQTVVGISGKKVEFDTVKSSGAGWRSVISAARPSAM